jgi:hypothetical protein
MLRKTIILIEHNTPKDHIGPIWQLFIETMEKISINGSWNEHGLLRCMDLIGVYIGVRKGTRVTGE